MCAARLSVGALTRAEGTGLASALHMCEADGTFFSRSWPPFKKKALSVIDGGSDVEGCSSICFMLHLVAVLPATIRSCGILRTNARSTSAEKQMMQQFHTIAWRSCAASRAPDAFPCSSSRLRIQMTRSRQPYASGRELARNINTIQMSEVPKDAHYSHMLNAWSIATSFPQG
jgi:hypothetical protein